MNYFALILPKLVSFLILLSVGYFVAWRGILRREGMFISFLYSLCVFPKRKTELSQVCFLCASPIKNLY